MRQKKKEKSTPHICIPGLDLSLMKYWTICPFGPQAIIQIKPEVREKICPQWKCHLYFYVMQSFCLIVFSQCAMCQILISKVSIAV